VSETKHRPPLYTALPQDIKTYCLFFVVFMTACALLLLALPGLPTAILYVVGLWMLWYNVKDAREKRRESISHEIKDETL
jgi:uncharacterized membrane protein